MRVLGIDDDSYIIRYVRTLQQFIGISAEAKELVLLQKQNRKRNDKNVGDDDDDDTNAANAAAANGGNDIGIVGDNNEKEGEEAIANAAMMSSSLPSSGEMGSVMKWIQYAASASTSADSSFPVPQLQQHPNCLLMSRLQICLDEVGDEMMERSTASNNNNKLRSFSSGLPKKTASLPSLSFSVRDFLTYNFKYIEGLRDVKPIVNIGAIPSDYFRYNLTLPDPKDYRPVVHNPTPGYCSEGAAHSKQKQKLPRSRTLLQVYHYPGTLEQRNFRQDVRGLYGNRRGTAPPKKCNITNSASLLIADDLLPWLPGFVEAVGGREEAERLLRNVGSTSGWPLSTLFHEQRQQRRNRAVAVFIAALAMFVFAFLPRNNKGKQLQLLVRRLVAAAWGKLATTRTTATGRFRPGKHFFFFFSGGKEKERRQ